MKLNNKAYDTLKWISMILLPATATFIGAVGSYVGWNATDTVVYILVAFNTFMGTLLGISNLQYHSDKDTSQH